MATITTFYDLEVFKLSRSLCKRIHLLHNNLAFKYDRGIVYQMKNSSGSIMDNIAEGFERGGKKEFIQFLYIAKGSAGELHSQLLRSCDLGYISSEEFEELIEMVITVSKKLGAFIRHLKTSEFNGPKYK